MKLARRARTPATEDSTTSRPCPWCRIRPATASMAEAGPVKLVVSTAAAATGSRSSASWSPSTPAATTTRSMSPKRSKTRSAKRRWPAVSVASKGTASTTVGPGRLGLVRRLGQSRARRGRPGPRCGTGPAPARPRWPGRSPRSPRVRGLTGAVRWRRS